MKVIREKVRQVLQQLQGPDTEDSVFEAAALIVGAAFFVIGFLVALPVFWGREIPIVGAGSIGNFAAYSGAITAALAFGLGRLAMRPADVSAEATRDGFSVKGDRLRWYDLIAIALAHSAIAFLGWLGIANLVERSFIGAPVFPFPGALLIGVVLALTAYICFLSAVALSPLALSFVLAVFLVVAAFAAMLVSTDPNWWRDNLSALGMHSNGSSPVFNTMLVIAGVIVTIIARYATASLPVDTAAQRRGRFVVRVGLIVIGIFLACVGLFPVDRFFLVHNTVATGMAVVFGVIVIGLPWLLPTIPRVFVALGWIYVVVIVVLSVYFAVGYYNLTAVELVAAVLIFSWIIVFLRTAGTHGPVDAVEQESVAGESA